MPLNPYHDVKSCRTCGGQKLTKYLDLGLSPLANSLVKDKAAPESSFPLVVLYCEDCSLSQLSIVVDPAVMFRDYCYRSSISQTFIKHCDELAAAAKQACPAAKNQLVVDIASNDGTLLQAFKKKGHSVLGVDPARNLAQIAEAAGVPTVAEFWSSSLAQSLAEKHGRASIITATNVFAHVDRVDDFALGISKFLSKDGIFVVEFPYLVDFIEHTEFDTVYHEHLSYFLLKPLVSLFSRFGLEIFGVQEVPIHGGSLRVFIKHADNAAIAVQPNVKATLSKEESGGYHTIKPYRLFADRAQVIRKDLIALCKQIKAEGQTIIGYGASAKGNTLLNFCQIGTQYIDMIIDDTPEKRDHLTPGQRIPIRSREALDKARCDYILILPWNFKDEIMRKTANVGAKYIVAIPRVTVL